MSNATGTVRLGGGETFTSAPTSGTHGAKSLLALLHGTEALTYRVVLDPEADGSAWNVSVPALPGCFTYGATRDEALERAREAVAAYVESLKKHGDPIPKSDAGGPYVQVQIPK